MLLDLHTDFSGDRSGGGLVFPSLEEFSTVGWDPHSQNLWHSQDSSVSKQSASNAGDPGLIPGSGRSTRKGIG